ncbi:lysine exporter protein (plasmid) [Bacillus cereus H3081.97]|nr:lysine exporter protein [Bacillus cereus H3081.97]EJP87473.1 hypothetical protein IAU_04407 [Bacillus cereus IS075]EJP98868.1 hypothetical protein IC5_04866 [Bacillus cereus AND1407]EOO83048.1 hypothetical protein IGS_05583 [Bacillus cereus IS845/00]EOO92763.1 hypothetical protein IGQ_05634 [Bacillus cereus IS195]KXI71516.1 lysine transporter LysE [Bacillus cereus]
MSITSFVFYCFIVTFTPGPTNIVILSTVHNSGTKKAMEYTYGATIAFGFLLAISAMLNTILATVIPKIIIVMQIMGSFYMLYLAYQVYKMDSSKPAVNQTGTFMSGFLTQFLNPKVSTIYNDCHSYLYNALLCFNACGYTRYYYYNCYWIFSIYYMGTFRRNL